MDRTVKGIVAVALALALGAGCKSTNPFTRSLIRPCGPPRRVMPRAHTCFATTHEVNLLSWFRRVRWITFVLFRAIQS